MKAATTIPKLRFSDFTQKWTILRMENIGRVIRGASPRPKGDKRYYGGTVPRLMVQDVTRDGKWVTPTIDSLTEAGAKLSRPCPAGTLTIVCSGTVGIVSFLAVDACIHDGFLALIDIDETAVTKDFLFHRLSTLREQFEQGATHGGIFTNLTTSGIKEFEFPAPTLPEQRKIADFLTAVDGWIGQLIQKKALLEDYKKGVMQQLFTQAIRFKDEHGNDFPEWEEKKLGEATKWASGGTPSKDNASFWEGDIPWLSAASMHERYYSDSPLRVSKEGVKSGSKMALKGTLLLLVRGSMLWNRIPVGITTRDVAFNQDVKALTPTGKVLAGFLLQWFIASENMLLHKVVGTGIGAGKLDTDEMKSLRFRLPTTEEQTKIADFLSALDRKIESVATQITETQTFKRGLLQQMFV
ncbi:MAG: restriction endonuclease subunit S [Verrucomicrobiota bacterium]